jgi:hypothetical protein
MHHTTTDDAATARSILSCPATVAVVVDGVDDVLADVESAGLALQDLDGVPTFSCPPDSLLARAAAEGQRALLTLESGLEPAGAGDGADTLTLGGRLVSRGGDACACCAEAREVVVLVVDLVALTSAGGGRARHLPVEDFTAPRHRLNDGFLRRCCEHATSAHQEELRHAVAALVDRPVQHVAGVSLDGLTPAGVRMCWVDASGSHVRDVVFPRAARTPDELGELLRRELSAGLC